MSENDFHANSVSTAHHSAIVVYLSATFQTILAVFTGGAFTAGLSFVTSEVGRLMMKTNYFYIAIIYFLSFGIAFFLAMTATGVLINYSYKSWRDHRSAIAKGVTFAEASLMTTGGYDAALTVAFSFAAMMAGMTCAVILALGSSSF